VADASRDPAESSSVAAKSIAEERTELKGVTEPRFYTRYDVGAYSYINVAFKTGVKSPPDIFVGCRVHASPSGYHIVLTDRDPVDDNIDLLREVDWKLYDLGPHWNDAPKPPYRYSFSLPNPFPATHSGLHPLSILFNGRPSHLLIDSQTIAPDPISAFVKQVVQTYRTGTKSQLLALWTQEDIEESGGVEPQISSYPSLSLTGKIYQAFTINFGPNVLVFLADATHPRAPWSHIYLWKGSSPGYHLTSGVPVSLRRDSSGSNNWSLGFGKFYSGDPMHALFSAEDTSAGAVDSLFDMPAFQNYLKSIVGSLRD